MSSDYIQHVVDPTTGETHTVLDPSNISIMQKIDTAYGRIPVSSLFHNEDSNSYLREELMPPTLGGAGWKKVGENYFAIQPASTPSASASRLLEALPILENNYTNPNGQPASETNPPVLFILPGVYDLGTLTQSNSANSGFMPNISHLKIVGIGNVIVKANLSESHVGLLNLPQSDRNGNSLEGVEFTNIHFEASCEYTGGITPGYPSILRVTGDIPNIKFRSCSLITNTEEAGEALSIYPGSTISIEFFDTVFGREPFWNASFNGKIDPSCIFTNGGFENAVIGPNAYVDNVFVRGWNPSSIDASAFTEPGLHWRQPILSEGSFEDGDKTKLDYVDVTANTDLDFIRSRVNELDAAVVLVGEWDASSETFPGSGSTNAGQSWIVSTNGTVNGVEFTINDRIVAIIDNPATDTYVNNWLKLDYSDMVLEIAGLTGTISASALRTAINVEDGATADQTDAEIKIAYENNTNTNAYTDVEKSKVGNVPADTINELSNKQAILTEGSFADGDKTKLDGIENNATADQTEGEIKVAYENNSNTNAYTDNEKTKVGNVPADTNSALSDKQAILTEGSFANGDKTKLDGIEENAKDDQTNAEIENAYNSQVPVVSQTEAEEGTETTVRRFSPLRIAQAIAALVTYAWENLTGTLTLSQLNDAVSDGTLDDTTAERDPKAHASEHVDGTDDVQDATSSQKGLMTSTQVGKLDGIEESANNYALETHDNTKHSINYEEEGTATSEISTHASVSNAHHDRYADTEAVSAMGTKENSNPLHHDRHTAAQIKTDYESNVDTNEYSDVEKSKVSNVPANTSNELSNKQDILTEGPFVDGDKTKLDNIEETSGSMTDSEVKTAYENNADTNAYTDSEKSKVGNVPADTNTELSNKQDILTEGPFVDGDKTNVDANTLHATSDGSDHANVVTNTADIAEAVTDTGGGTGNAEKLLETDANGKLDGRDVGADGTKLDTIQEGATDDQTGSEIKAAYEAEADTNAYSDAEKAKVASLITGENKLDATTTPTANDDNANTSGDGVFTVGSLWVDVSNDEAYRCIDASTGAAVWVKTTLDSTELSAVALSGSFSDLIGSISVGQIPANIIANSKLAQMAQATIMGRANGVGTGDVTDLTADQVRTLLNIEDDADKTDADNVNPVEADPIVAAINGIIKSDGTTISAATADTDYASAAKGVTNGDSHDHSSGDGGSIAHSNISGIGTDDHHARYTDSEAKSAVTKSDVGLSNVPDEDATNMDNWDQNGATDGQVPVWDNTSGKYVPQDPVGTYTDDDAQTAINNDADHGSTAPHNYFDGVHGSLSGVNSDDHHAKYTDGEARAAINNDTDHGSTASHNYNTFGGAHSNLTGIGTDDHHARYTDAEAKTAVTKSDLGLDNVPNEDATNPDNWDQSGATHDQVMKWDTGLNKWSPGNSLSSEIIDNPYEV